MADDHPDSTDREQRLAALNAQAQAEGYRQIDVDDLIDMCLDRATHPLSNKKNKNLFANCAFAMKQMLNEIVRLRTMVVDMGGDPEQRAEEATCLTKTN